MMIVKEKFDKILFINFVFAFFPISFILGNLIININTVLFCLLGIFYLKSEILKNELNFSFKIIFSFFLIVFISTVINLIQSIYSESYEYNNLYKLLKSIFFFRFFLFLFIVYLLTKFSVLNFKYFFISSSICIFIISLDIIYQYIFGFNIIGLKTVYHNSSFFGDEWIAGGYVQNFAFFPILFLSFLLKNKDKFFLITIPALIFIIAAAILLSGNKMPVILFTFGLFLLFIFNPKIRKILIFSIIIFFISLNFSDKVKERLIDSSGYMVSIFTNIQPVINEILLKSEKKLPEGQKDEDSKLLVNKPEHWGHIKLFATAIDTWKKNKIFGNGIKSFREDCHEVALNIKNRICSNHPHNYYLEVLTETGIIGLCIIIAILIKFAFFIFKNFNSLKKNNIGNLFLLAAIISLFLEIFPIKSTGSVFSTNNSTYLILMTSIILSYKKLLSVVSFK